HPNETEVDNDLDDNCDGLIDNQLPDYDDDGDGFSEDEGDCDDDNEQINPNETEIDNDLDDNCDGLIDNQLPSYDDDGDGFSEDEGDCDDDNENMTPDKAEICDDQLDNNCDDMIDQGENSIGCISYYIDLDQDGFPADDQKCLCDEDEDEGYIIPVLSGEENSVIDFDCQDNNDLVKPDQTLFFEAPYIDADGNDSFDYNCDDNETLESEEFAECGYSLDGVDYCVVNVVGWIGPDSIPLCGESDGWVATQEDCEKIYTIETVCFDLGFTTYCDELEVPEDCVVKGNVQEQVQACN
ncbi:MAG: hypothetical protein CMK59_10345, partial [Proteobacteria bacterium]|nr:hypothetical protein [Pseudomonadota bacterium]